MRNWRRLLGAEDGASSIEYGFIAVFIAGAIVAIVVILGGQVLSLFEAGSSGFPN